MCDGTFSCALSELRVYLYGSLDGSIIMLRLFLICSVCIGELEVGYVWLVTSPEIDDAVE